MDGERSGHTMETNLLIEQCHARHRGQQAQAHAWHPTTEQEAVPRRSKLASKQAATAVQPHALSWHEPMLEMERILIVVIISTQDQAKEEAPPASRVEGQDEDMTAKP
jgi:hypothetical protein